MKIEVGKFYKTATDKKVRIYAIGLSSTESEKGIIHGAWRDEDGDWRLNMWFGDGRDVDDDSDFDIVSEWEEPKAKPKLKAWLMSATYNQSNWGVNFRSDDASPDINCIRAPWLDPPEE